VLRIGLGTISAASAAAALALGGQNMVLGRMSQARPDAPSAATTTHARAHYVLHCAGCHGFNAAGSPGAGVPDMRRMGEFLRVPGGREFIIKVPGVMASGLNDQQIADVTNWLLRTWARDSVPEGTVSFDAPEVARARLQPIVDVAAERRRLVQQAKSMGLALE